MKQFTIPSASQADVVYTVTVSPEGRFSCECIGFIKGKNKECRHIKDIKKELGVKTEATVREVIAQPTFLPAATGGWVAPMLAKALKDTQSFEDFENDDFVMEEKVDGHRMIVRVDDDNSVNAWARVGNSRLLPGHLRAALRNLAAGTYDGELYVPGGTSTDVTALVNQDKLQLVLFDIIKVGETLVTDIVGTDRRKMLELAASKLSPGAGVHVIEQRPPSHEALKRMWDAGLEGVIIKRKKALYHIGKRSPDWVKFKKGQIARARITGFLKGKMGPHSRIVAIDPEGIEVKCKTLNLEWLRWFKEDAERFIGKTLVFGYQERTKADGKYRHPMADHIEED